MKKNLTPVMVLFAVCVAVTAVVAFADFLTADKIEENARESETQTMRELMPEASNFTEASTSADKTYIGLDDSGKTVGYVFVTTGTGGYAGDVVVMTAIDADGIVTGLQIIEDEETQGLGKNAHNEEYREQYVGKDTDAYTVVKGEPSAEGEIQALAGATKTSRAVTEAVNLAKAAAKELSGGNPDD